MTRKRRLACITMALTLWLCGCSAAATDDFHNYGSPVAQAVMGGAGFAVGGPLGGMATMFATDIVWELVVPTGTDKARDETHDAWLETLRAKGWTPEEITGTLGAVRNYQADQESFFDRIVSLGIKGGAIILGLCVLGFIVYLLRERGWTKRDAEDKGLLQQLLEKET